jgi:hypothetical protein
MESLRQGGVDAVLGLPELSSSTEDHLFRRQESYKSLTETLFRALHKNIKNNAEGGLNAQRRARIWW